MDVFCQGCRVERRLVQPYRRQGTRDIVWFCPWCGVPEGATALPVPCTHERYHLGLDVYVSPALREIHPFSPCAGLVLPVCRGVYYPSLEIYASRAYTTKVPVQLPDLRVFLVEEEYIVLV